MPKQTFNADQAGGGGGSPSTWYSGAGAPGEQLELTYVSDGDANGVAYYAGKNYSAASGWVNPYTAGYLGIVTNGDNQGGDVKSDIVDRVANHYSSLGTGTPGWLYFDLGVNRKILLKRASYRYRDETTTYAPVAWTWDGSNDGVTWTSLLAVSGQTPALSAWVTSTIPPATGYRYIRYQMTGNNNSGTPHMSVGEVELYGTLTSSGGTIIGGTSIGSNGDYYRDTNTQDVHYKTSGAWAVKFRGYDAYVAIPATASSSGTQGQRAIDTANGFIYECVATNSWVRYSYSLFTTSAEQVFTYSTSGDSNGLFYFMGKGNTGGGVWQNPVTRVGAGLLQISANGQAYNSSSAAGWLATTWNYDKTTNRADDTFHTGALTNPYITFDLGVGLLFKPNGVGFRQRQDSGSTQSTSIHLDASTDGASFSRLLTSAPLSTGISVWNFLNVAQPATGYRFLRIISADQSYLAGNEVEFYGSLTGY